MKHLKSQLKNTNLIIGIIEILLAIIVLHDETTCQTAICKIFGESIKTLSTILIFSGYLLLATSQKSRISENVKYIICIFASLPLIIMFIPLAATGHYIETIFLAAIIIFLALNRFLPKKNLTSTPFKENTETVVWLILGISLYTYNVALNSANQELFYCLIVIASIFNTYIFHILNTEGVTFVNSNFFPVFLYNSIALIMIHITGKTKSPLIFFLVLTLIFSTNYIKKGLYNLILIVDIAYFAVLFLFTDSTNYNARLTDFIYTFIFILIGYSLSVFSIKKT